MLLGVPISTAKSAKLESKFPATGWQSVLKLLGLIIVADKKIFKEEIETFREAVTELRAIIDPTICISEKMALDWFNLNKPALAEIIDTMSHDTAICEIIAPIKHMPHKLDVISCMVRIAVSDGEYCDVEKSLISKTCLYWNVRDSFQPNLEFLHKPHTGPNLVEHLKNHPQYERVLKTYRKY